MEHLLTTFENEDAYAYAFIGALKQHLRVVATDINLRILEETKSAPALLGDYRLSKLMIELKDIQGDFELVEVVVNDFLEYKLQRDMKLEKNWGSKSKALVNNFEHILLGSNVDDKPRFLTSESILKTTIDNNDVYELKISNELCEIFYTIFKDTFEIYQGLETSINVIIATYLQQRVSAFCDIIAYLQGIRTRLNNVVEYLLSTSKETVLPDIALLGKIETGFKILLKNTLSLQFKKFNPYPDHTVASLREQGNNLMSNKAYAQAIKVYTQAIGKCVGDSTVHLPQLLVNRAIGFIGLECFPEAVSDLNKALDVDLTFVPAWVQLGYAELYLSNSLIALKCYAMALRCCTGDILPYNYPDHVSKNKYRNHRRKTVLPQFIEQLVRSIELTETRAKQQLKPRSEINDIIDNIKASLSILALNSKADPHYFAYPSTGSNPSTFTSLAASVNQARPSLLNQDTIRDIRGRSESYTRSAEIIAVETRPVRSASFPANRDNVGSGGSPASDTTTQQASVTSERTRTRSRGNSASASTPARGTTTDGIRNIATFVDGNGPQELMDFFRNLGGSFHARESDNVALYSMNSNTVSDINRNDDEYNPGSDDNGLEDLD